MTVTATPRRTPTLYGNGVTTAFPFTFRVFAKTDVKVYVTSAAGATTTAVLDSDYSMTLNADQSVAPGGTITYPISGSPLPLGASLVALGALPYDQTLSLPPGGNFNAGAVEQAMDRTEMQIQQIAAGLLAAVQAPAGESIGQLPAAAVRANTTLGFDSAGNPTVLTPFGGTAAILSQVPTHTQFVGDGAFINKLNDRVMVGDATVNDGAYPNVTKDFLSAFQVAQGISNGTILGCQMGVLADHLVPGLGGAFLAGVESLNAPYGNYGILANTAIAVNNATAGGPIEAWAFYGEAHRMSNIVGGAIGMELDVTQFGSLQQMNPYALAAGEAVGIKLAAGAGFSGTGQFDATAGIVVGGNPMKFDKGLVFLANGISGTDGVTGTGYAIALAKGHVMQWFAVGGVPTGSVVGTGTTTANAMGISLGEGVLSFLAGGVNHTLLQRTASAVNYLKIFNAATANPVTLQSVGTDANVDLQLLTQGTAYVRFGSASHFSANGSVATVLGSLGPAGSHTTVQEWLTFKNASGTIRYIPAF